MPAEGYRGLVLVRDIPFQSLCEHHLLPFRGLAHVGFLPGDHLIGCRPSLAPSSTLRTACSCRSASRSQVHDWLRAR